MDFLYYAGAEGEQAEAYAHVMVLLDDTGVMLNTEDESAFTGTVSVELADISGTLPIWE